MPLSALKEHAGGSAVLGVYKPRGMARYGRRKLHEQRKAPPLQT